MNNASIFTADRTTHLKIVVAALICSTVVAGIGIAARMNKHQIDIGTEVQFLGADRQHRHPVFVRLDLPRHADDHPLDPPRPAQYTNPGPPEPRDDVHLCVGRRHRHA